MQTAWNFNEKKLRSSAAPRWTTLSWIDKALVSDISRDSAQQNKKRYESPNEQSESC